MLPFFIFSQSFIKIRRMVGVLDQFLHFLVFMIFSTPIQDRRLKFSGIKYFHILHTFIKFYRDLLIGWGASSIPRFLSFHDFLYSYSRQTADIYRDYIS